MKGIKHLRADLHNFTVMELFRSICMQNTLDAIHQALVLY